MLGASWQRFRPVTYFPLRQEIPGAAKFADLPADVAGQIPPQGKWHKEPIAALCLAKER